MWYGSCLPPYEIIDFGWGFCFSFLSPVLECVCRVEQLTNAKYDNKNVLCAVCIKSSRCVYTLSCKVNWLWWLYWTRTIDWPDNTRDKNETTTMDRFYFVNTNTIDSSPVRTHANAIKFFFLKTQQSKQEYDCSICLLFAYIFHLWHNAFLLLPQQYCRQKCKQMETEKKIAFTMVIVVVVVLEFLHWKWFFNKHCSDYRYTKHTWYKSLYFGCESGTTAVAAKYR